MGASSQKAESKVDETLKVPTILIVKDDGKVNFNEKLAAELRNINFALVPDDEGPIVKENLPVSRDPETHRMSFRIQRYRPITVPPDQVVFFTGNPIADFHNSHSATVNINGARTVVVFDRTYIHGTKTFNQCAWVPDERVRAGILYEKKISKQSRQPFAVMKKLGVPPDKTPRYQLVGGKEADYRDLRRIFERIFIRKAGPVAEDEELDRWMHMTIPPVTVAGLPNANQEVE